MHNIMSTVTSIWGSLYVLCCTVRCYAMQELTLYHPENAWSLLGLKQARPGDAELAKRWKAAAASADVSIDSSCPALATSI